MMKNLSLTLFLIILIVACNENTAESNQNEIIEYYSGNSKSIFKKTVHLKENDSVYYYYKNGNLFKKGKQNGDNQKIGNWQLFDKESNLREIREWFNINDSSHINRVWFLDKKGDTLAWRNEHSVFKQKEFIGDTLSVRASDYIFFEFNKDTISLDEPIRGTAYCFSPRIGKDFNSQIRVFLHIKNENFNSPFPNDSVIRKNSFDNLKNDTINQKWFSDIEPERYGHVAVFGYWFENPGEKLLTGYLEEFSYGPFKKKTIDSITSRVYFEKKIYVKDTIK